MARSIVVLLLVVCVVGLGASTSADSLVHPLLVAGAVALVAAARGRGLAKRRDLAAGTLLRPIGGLRVTHPRRSRGDSRAALEAATLLLRRS